MKKKRTEKRIFDFWVVVLPPPDHCPDCNRFLAVTPMYEEKYRDLPTLFNTRKQARMARNALTEEHGNCGAKVVKAELSFDWKV